MSTALLARWVPALILGAGALGTVGIDTQRSMPLRDSLESGIPVAIADHDGVDLELSPAERRVAGVTSYLLREYRPAGSAAAGSPRFQLYVGYYDRQLQGRTIHSPKNCLPGAGWEALAAGEVDVPAAGGPVRVNKYLLQKGDEQALVLYWYQGRGRVAANEYRVKWDLLRDAALQRRTEEALVRIVVPVTAREADALALARDAATTVISSLAEVLPT